MALTPTCKTSKRQRCYNVRIFLTASETPPISIDIDMLLALYAPGRALSSSSAHGTADAANPATSFSSSTQTDQLQVKKYNKDFSLPTCSA